MFHRHALPFLLTLLALAAQMAPQALRYERAAVLHGQVWRLLTGHLTHLGTVHLLLNLGALWLIWLLFADTVPARRWLGGLLVTALGCGLALLLLSPTLAWYVGLSGVLHGLLVIGAAGEWRRGRRPLAAVLLGGLALKLAWEQTVGAMPGSTELVGSAVVVEAHLYGALAGVAAALVPGRGFTAPHRDTCAAPPRRAARCRCAPP